MSDQKKSRYLQYLPAIFQEDSFLGKFLSPFEEVLTGFGDLLSDIDDYFAPALTDPDFLPWLANWLALVLDEDWDEEKRRRLIGEAVELYRRRGTVKGLKRYLEIYAGLVPEIRECRWPGGMQIGVASRIGGIIPDNISLASIKAVTRVQPLIYHDYYVVDTVAPASYPEEPECIDMPEVQPLQLYYCTSLVKKVETGMEVDDEGIEQPHVDILLYSDSVPKRYKPATVTRRDGLVDDRYILKIDIETEVEYIGDTFLVDEEELPYCFVVDVRVPFDDLEDVKLDKVRAIVDLEKPAHTMYYLKLTPVVSEYMLHPMQIGICCTIGLDTIIG